MYHQIILCVARSGANQYVKRHFLVLRNTKKLWGRNKIVDRAIRAPLKLHFMGALPHQQPAYNNGAHLQAI